MTIAADILFVICANSLILLDVVSCDKACIRKLGGIIVRSLVGKELRIDMRTKIVTLITLTKGDILEARRARS